MLIFDIGCNHGNWTAANYEDTDLFVCVDALTSAYLVCQKRFALRDNVAVLHNLVTYEDKKTGTLFISEVSTGEVSTASQEWIERSRHKGQWLDTEEVPTITLDALIKLFGLPDFIKIDVEGYEYNVLLGLTQKVNMLCFEYAEELRSNAMFCIDRLRDLGFTKFHRQHGDNYTYRPDSWVSYDYMKNHIKRHFLTERAESWGMIWSK